MQLYKTQKKVLRIGPQALSFLNGLTSNDMDQPHNAFLNMHGRIIATFDQVQVGQGEFWIVLEEDFVDAVLNHLDRYARLSSIEISRQAHGVYFDLQGSYVAGLGEYVIPQAKGKLIVTLQNLPVSVTEEQFLWFRLQNKIPVQGKDYRDEFVLNVSMTDFVSFAKGCFLGQEPIAKVYHRSQPTWRLVVLGPQQNQNMMKDSLTSNCKDPQSGGVWGFSFVRNDGSQEE